MTTLEEFLTTTEVASSLGLHPNTIKRLCRLGKLKGKKVNNGWLILKKEMESFASTYLETRGRPCLQTRSFQWRVSMTEPKDPNPGTLVQEMAQRWCCSA